MFFTITVEVKELSSIGEAKFVSSYVENRLEDLEEEASDAGFNIKCTINESDIVYA